MRPPSWIDRTHVAGAALLAGLAAAVAVHAQDPQRPAFRAGVDLIQLDVSVLDKSRHPVRGLTTADFTVLENGKPQRLVTVSSVDAAERDPVRSAWMRYATHDVATNDLADELGDGRLFAIVIDDMNLPADDADILLSARSTARYVLDLLGPSDRAAVVFAQDSGKTQDFTDDRAKLLDAVDRLQPRGFVSIEPTPLGLGPGGGDMPQRFSPMLMRSPCARGEPVLPALDAVTGRLATLPGQRKTVFYIGVGAVVSGTGRGPCDVQLNDMMRGILRKAQQANINIHTVDPAGRGGYQEYLAQQAASREQERQLSERRLPPSNLRALRDFMKSLAESTGGRAVIDTDAVEPAIDQVFDEDGSYYLLGYETSNGAPDGKFRKVEVLVKRPDTSVRTRSGYWAPEASAASSRRDEPPPSSGDLSLSGLMSPQGMSLRATAMPLALTPDPRHLVDVGLVLSVKWPPLRAAADETLSIVRNLYDADGRPGPPVQESVHMTLQPGGGDETRVDLRRRLALAPGRYQVRFNVTSTMLKKEGSVYVDLEVPDLARSPLALSGIVVGAPQEPDAGDSWKGLAPLVPTTSRDFAPGEAQAAFVRVFQGGVAPAADVSLTVEVYDAHDASRFSTTTALPGASFGPERTAVYQVPLPLDQFTPGPYLLSITAALPGGRKTRQDLVFRMR